MAAESRRKRARMRSAALALLIGAGLGLPGCGTELDTERITPTRGSIGAEIYKVVCERMASEALPSDVSGEQTRALCRGAADPSTAPSERLRVLAENRDRLVGALDQVFPEAMADDLDAFLLQMVPFYDGPEERLPQQTRAAADLLTRIMDDPEALDALARLGQRVGYRPLRLGLGIARPMMAYPRLTELTNQALATVAEGGVARSEWEALLEATALEMASAAEDPAPAAEPSTLALTRDLLMRQADVFGAGASRPMVLRDSRGMALPLSTGGALPAPFADVDGDGLADIDSLGRFVDASGAAIDAPSPFPRLDEPPTRRDPIGRALGADGAPLFAYHDVNTTLLAGVIREALPLLDPAAPALLDLGYGAPALLGPSAPALETFGAHALSYEGFELDRSPLLDLLYALGVLLEAPETDEVLALSELLLRDHEEAVGALTDAAMRGDASSEAYPEAALVPGSELWDDVLQVAEYIAQEPGLLEALLRSFADPRSHRLGHIYAEMMSFRDPIALDSPDFNRELLDQEWTMPVDRGRSDTGDNVSLFQQSIAIIHDLSGVRVCNRDGATLALTFDLPIFGWTDFDVPFLSYGECELFEIQDVAETFALSIIGRAEIQIKPALLSGILAITGPLGLTADSLLEGQSGIVGLTTRPTPQALARLVFAPRGRFLTSLIGPPSVAPLTRDGVPIVDQHDPVVMAWERSFRFCGDTLLPPGGPCASPEDVTFYEAMTPLLTAFDDHDRRTGGRFLFASLISAFHLHYASPANDRSQSTARAAPFFSHQDDAVSFEPIVAELFADCVWEPSGGGRRCVPERGAQLLSSLAEMQVRMDGIELRPGVDGIDAMAALASRMIDPTLNGALRDRRGGATTQTNAGSRTLPLTPIYLLLDALSATDARWASEPDRHARWLEGRGVLVDTLLATTRTAGGARMNNRRSLELLRIILPFVRDRIAAHRAAGDLHAWASTLDERLGETLGSAQGAALLRFLDAIQRDPIAREEIAQLTAYLVSDASANDAFDATVLAAADLLQLLEDDLNLLPLLHALSGAVAEGAQDAVLTGAPVSVREGTTDATIALAQELGAVDDTRALGRILANLVELPSSGPPETPLEVLVDVISEVGRASPGEGGTLSAEDYHHVMGEAVDLLSSEERGLERLYDVIQNRELSP